MASKDKKVPKPNSNRNDRIRTLADLNRPSGPDSDSDSDSPQEYYTGGQKSGMLVQDPKKKKDVDDIFNQAKQFGVDEAPIGGLQSSSTLRSFTGTGRLLSGETVPSSSSQQPEAIVHDIVFWQNGFTVNDGPLRRLDDPENATFLESITKSEFPKELEPADRRSSVHVRLTRKNEKHTEPERSTISFQGVGRTLGGNTIPSSSDPTLEYSTSSSSSSTPVNKLVVDETKPSTSIQLRLADGTRLVAHFNYHHTVGDIRAFIDASMPGDNRSYQLQTVGFPPKQLNDLGQTVEQAELANSVIIQKR
ncbi:hypothetical protein V2J09_002925 [Rumex salicifolius]